MRQVTLRRALIALTLALATGARAQAPMRAWTVPQPIGEVEVTDRVQAAGVPVAMHALRSRARWDVVLADLRRQFLAAGLYLPPARDVPQLSTAPQLTGFDPDTKTAYTVFLQKNKDRTTTALFTEASLAEPPRAEPAVTFAPVMPGAHAVLLSGTEGLKVASYRVKASLAEVTSFYDEALPRVGFTREGPGRFALRDEVLQVTARAAESGEVSVGLMRGPSPSVPVSPAP
ncbi:MAG: hypothetical protein K1X89_26755 [Myxococcaceae bacterium]|nr:hypothetical protein [Myxococcaceae bacterium]